MPPARKFFFLILIVVFFFLLGNRVTPGQEVPLLPALPPVWVPLLPAPAPDELATAFPEIPLRLQPPVTGVTDLTINTIGEWLSDRSPEVFLTFDDGPSPQATGRILDILRAYDVKATFFVLGRNVALFPGVVQQAISDGHEIALHSHNHFDLLTLSRAAKEQEIAEGLSVLHWLFPALRIRWFRPPYGQYDQDVVDIVHDYGMCLAMFNEISIDSATPAEQITQTLLGGQGRIIVLHDGQWPRPGPFTEAEARLVTGLGAAIGPLKAQGAQFKTLSSHFGRFCP